MQTDPRALRSYLQSRKGEIAASHRAGAGGFATCAALTRMMDEAIVSACQSLPSGTMNSIALVALGGYGRCELSPHSDVDIMVLCPKGGRREEGTAAAKEVLHYLWDVGIDVGHSVRSVDEAVGLFGVTFDSWASMLESRFLYGDTALADEFYDEMRATIRRGPPDWFVGAVFDDVAARHERYGSSVKLLEPNIKKSAGGLRDVHTTFWLHRGTDAGYFTRSDAVECATKHFLDRLRADAVLDAAGHGAAVRALEFLLRVRHEMHFRRESQHDTLEYALQSEVAEGIGVEAAPPLQPVEVFMHEYYVHARTAHRLLQHTGQRFRESIEPPRAQGSSGTRIGPSFILYDDALSVDTAVASLTDPAHVFEAYALSAEHEAPADLRLRGILERSPDLIRPAHADDPRLAAQFRRILRTHRVAETLHEMNDADILPRYIPEFGALVAFFQHNVYHYYTADEHTLIAIANAERLREKQGVLHEVFRNLPRKDVLYAAILLHDIAKPRGVADHEVTGVAMSGAILRRLGMDDAVADVGFLVRHHLVMEQTAFRRNVHDPDTLKEFAARFPRPGLLDYLYVLTYADLAALNASVWTDWKDAMLRELYQRTAEVLRRNLSGAAIDEFHREQRMEAAGSVVEALSGTIPRERVRAHLDGIQDASYLALFSEEEILEHIRRAEHPEEAAVLFARPADYTEITVIARDAPFALSKFCAVLAANDANIFDANIFTRDDGVVIDRFRVTDAATPGALEQQRCEKIEADLRQVLRGALDIGHLFREHARKWKRRPKAPPNATVSTDVRFEENPRFTIIDVYAPDSVGFLYRVTEAMSHLGLDIYFAKIATRVDGIVDAFYTLDRNGRQITEPAAREAIREKLLDTILALTRERLARSA
ncbi:MAG TPA: [protein-PII] uridylyltransferase [Bacteroidota bacterium]|nr:[protein-PII] uridylyltransferase [Bacteroidota bacterium]